MSKSKEGWLKVKLAAQSKWHRRYCTIDWDKSVFFMASRSDTRYREWIKLAPSITINDHDSFSHSEPNSSSLLISIHEMKEKGVTVTHLLQAESKADYDRWLLALKQAAYSRTGGGIFGQSLEATYRYSADKSSVVPAIVRQCCEYLLEHGSTFVGLFRVPGKQTSVKELRDLYDRGLPVRLQESESPATVSSLLKIYLQALPDPIIPADHFDEFLELGSRLKYDQTSDLTGLKQLIDSSLCNIHHEVLAYLCLFLRKLTEHAHATKMDADNLAVVFGSNLIRPSEELDLNMVRGHSYNLIPLVKVLIDQSEYLFLNNNNNSSSSSNNSSPQSQDSYEQATESITKSSGFSSFSSLLSTPDHGVNGKSRSTSMPSICMETVSSTDSAHVTLENDADRRADRSHSTQRYSKSSATDFLAENQLDRRPKRYGSMDALSTTNERPLVQLDLFPAGSSSVQPRTRAVARSHPVSAMDMAIPVRKMEKCSPKKGLANRFGKSIFNLKTTMSKALQGLPPANEAEPSSSADSVSTRHSLESKSSDQQGASLSVKQLQREIDLLKELLEHKQSIIIGLRQTAYEERSKFEQERAQLNQRIEQLHEANTQLKKQLGMR